jgi:type II restriction enzyme
MRLGFQEAQTPYDSGAQSARFWTERWFAEQAFCPNCGNPKVNQYRANKPVADFYCTACNEVYELKSQKPKIGSKVLDGAYGTMCTRLEESNSPNLCLMKYDRAALAVTDLLVVPKQFFVREVIEERKPLAPTARRAGWVGCNILLDRIPPSGKIYIVRDGQELPREAVLAEWRRTLFLRDERPEARGWVIEVMKCVEALGKQEFQLDDVYAFELQLSSIYPNNLNVRPKIRQQLQVLRDHGYLDFLGRGSYRLRTSTA